MIQSKSKKTFQSWEKIFIYFWARLVTGHLNTLEDWSFLARFCFISGRGKYEYEIEFDRLYGEPQLLLYYDDMSQWPSVYKSGMVIFFKENL